MKQEAHRFEFRRGFIRNDADALSSTSVLALAKEFDRPANQPWIAVTSSAG